MTHDPQMVGRVRTAVWDAVQRLPIGGIESEESDAIADAALEASHHAELVSNLEVAVMQLRAAIADPSHYISRADVEMMEEVLAKLGGDA